MTSPVSQRTIRGMALLGANTAITKVLNSASQLVLAALLVPEDFGLVALAFTIFSFVGVFERVGLRETLIRKQRWLRRWSNSSIWLAGSLGITAMLLMLGVTPLAAWAWDTPKLLGVAGVLSLAMPFQTTIPVLEAHLEVDLRYKGVTVIAMASNAIRVVLAIVLASLGFGAYSFVIPRVIDSATRCLAMVVLVRPRLIPRPQFRRWPSFFHVGVWFFGATLCEVGMMQIDYLVLGFVATQAELGLYYFAFGQSMQVVQLFVINAARVVMPGLSAITGGPEAQVTAFRRALRLMALFIAPMGILQALTARPLLGLLFGTRWDDAVVYLQILTVAAVFTALGGLSISLINAQGRVRTLLWSRIGGLSLFIVCVVSGAQIGVAFGQPVLGVAFAILVSRLVYGPVMCYVACQPGQVSFWKISAPFIAPLAGAGLACLAALAIDPILPNEMIWVSRDFHAVKLVTRAIVFSAAYLGWVLVFHRTSANEIRHKLLPMLLGRRDRSSAASIEN